MYKDYLDHLELFGVKLGIENISLFLKLLEDPHLSFPTILIGGTNGKGSTSCMMAEILKRGGYRVGLYTSPHLISPLERIRVDGRIIDDEEFERLLLLLKDKKEMWEERYVSLRNITYFEFLTAIAFYHFREVRVDIAILEVGLGARLDATNVCNPEVSAITNISFDHTDILGKTLTEIAREKAFVSRRGKVLVSCETKEEPLRAMKGVADERGSILYLLNREFFIKEGNNHDFNYDGRWLEIDNLVPAMKGEYQFHNASCAIALVENLCKATSGRFGQITPHVIRDGIASARFPGRFQVIDSTPSVIFDCAHNTAGAESLAKTLHQEREEGRFERLLCIAGLVKKKDGEGFFRALSKEVDVLEICEIKNRRGEDPERLRDEALKSFSEVKIFKDVSDAIRAAMKMSCNKDAILITGSHYLVGEAMEYLGVRIG